VAAKPTAAPAVSASPSAPAQASPAAKPATSPAAAASPLAAASPAAAASAVVAASPVAGGTTSTAAASCNPSEAAAKYPDLANKTLQVGISPFSPGYETADPNDPNHIVGFDPDMIQALTDCLGFKYAFQSIDFSGLVGALQANRIDMIFSSMYATPERAAQVNFVLYQKASTGSIVRKGNPKGIQSIEDTCGTTAAEVTGTVEAQTLQDQSDKCTAAGKQEVNITLYKDNDACVQALQTGRADIFMTDAGLASALAKQFSDSVDRGFSIPSQYRFGVGVNKSNTQLLNAVLSGLSAIQANGTETQLLQKWGFDPSQLEPAAIVTQ
jgi:polar amino acid transport system substrate-binding protein